MIGRFITPPHNLLAPAGFIATPIFRAETAMVRTLFFWKTFTMAGTVVAGGRHRDARRA